MTAGRARPGIRRVPAVGYLAAAVSAGSALLIVAATVRSVQARPTALWILGRACGLAAFILLLCVVLVGLVLSHPWRNRIARPSGPSRIRAHIVLAVVAIVLLIAHIAFLAADSYAGVGTKGALVPFAATYRPSAVAFGVVAAWLIVLIGSTAALAGRIPARAWWPLHKIAAISLVLCWVHAAFAGSDTAVLRWFYLATALLVVGVAMSRYIAVSSGDRRRQQPQ